MKYKLFYLITFLLTVLFFIAISCNNKQPFKPDYKNIGGVVIGKETCNTDDANDYWLIDFNYYPDQPQRGDTLILDGIIYTNVLKVKGLDPKLKHIGIGVAIDYNKIGDRELTTGCTVNSPVVYNLKEIFIIDQGEIR